MNVRNLFLILLVIAMVMVLLFGIIFLQKSNSTNIVVTNTAYGILVTSPKEHDAISSPVTIAGLVNGNGWAGFEGQVGTVKLLDASGKELAATYLKATTEWTQLPTNFETSLTFTAVSSTSGSLVFHNENPSGDPVRNKTVTVPITFK